MHRVLATLHIEWGMFKAPNINPPMSGMASVSRTYISV